MKAGEIANKFTVPKDLPGWDESLEAVYQRDINYKRVKDVIAPYFANTPSRFCGSVIVTALNFNEEECFQSISEFTNVNKLYKSASKNMGVIIFDGGEVLVPLDGQHRLKALEFAISGKDHEGNDIDEIKKPCTELAQEDICVILVPFNEKKAREIFTKVNRYAKTPTVGDNIIIDDNDICAILTRKVTNELLTPRLVKRHAKSLTGKSVEFSTLATVYTCTKIIIQESFGVKLVTHELPTNHNISIYTKEVMAVWKSIIKDINLFHSLLLDKSENGDDFRISTRINNLLARPIIQECLFEAYYRLIDDPTNFSHSQACQQLNKIPWIIDKKSVKLWQNLFWVGDVKDGRMITKYRGVGTRVIAYMAGEKLSPTDKTILLKDHQRLFPESQRKGLKLPTLSEY